MSESIRGAVDAALGATHAIERELGGGMSYVFVATERALGRRVVIKVLGDAARSMDSSRFRQEILLSAALQHPHIVPVHSAGEIEGIPYFVMPYVEGVSLRARLTAGGAFPVAEAVRVLRDVAAALQYAHARGVVHRDLKPENVMLSGGSAVVLDFGVAKAMVAGVRTAAHAARADAGTLTGAGFAVGTPRYMAPEQAVGDPNLDHRADIYAFGLLAFELFAGRAVFDGSPSDVLRKHIAEPAPDPRTLRPELPPALAVLVHACLQKAPDDRPRDAAAVLDALDGVSIPVAVVGTARGAPGASKTRTRGAWLEALAVPVTYVAAAGGVLWYLFRLAAEERVREGVVAAGVIGALLGLPLAVAGGLLLRLVGRERST